MKRALAAAMLAATPAVHPLDPATTLVLVEDRRTPRVELRLEVPAGTWSPWFRKEGGEAAWEALLLDPDRALLKRADVLAVEVATTVGTRACTLRASFLREDLDAMVDLLRDALRGEAFDRGELKRRARQRVLGWRLGRKDPSFVLRAAAAAVLFEEGDPRRLAWEKPRGDVPGNAALAAVQDRMLALPGRVLGLAGDVDLETARAVAERLLPPARTDLPEGLVPELKPPVALDRREDGTVSLPGLTQVYLAEVRTALPVAHEDAPAFAIADHVLGGHFYSRLYRALRHEGGETYGASTSRPVEAVEMLYAATTFTRNDNAAATERKLRRVLTDLQASGITEEERAGAVGYLRGRMPFSRQSPGQVLERALLERRLGLPPGSMDALADRAEGTTLEQVNAFVRRFYDPAQFRLVKVSGARR